MTVKKAYTNYNTLFDNLRIQDTGEMVNWREVLVAHKPEENNFNKSTTITLLLKLSPNFKEIHMSFMVCQLLCLVNDNNLHAFPSNILWGKGWKGTPL